MFQVNVCMPDDMLVVGQSIGWSHTVGPPFQVSELKPHTLGRGPTTERPWVWVSTLMKLYPAIWLNANAPPHTGNCATPLVTSSGLVTAPQNQLRDGGLWISPCASAPPASPHSASSTTAALNGLMMVMVSLLQALSFVADQRQSSWPWPDRRDRGRHCSSFIALVVVVHGESDHRGRVRGRLPDERRATEHRGRS